MHASSPLFFATVLPNRRPTTSDDNQNMSMHVIHFTTSRMPPGSVPLTNVRRDQPTLPTQPHRDFTKQPPTISAISTHDALLCALFPTRRNELTDATCLRFRQEWHCRLSFRMVGA
jgi:hypothetical protein